MDSLADPEPSATTARGNGGRTGRGMVELRAHLRRVGYAQLGSEWLPAFLRTRLLRRLGATVADSACVWSGCMLRSMAIELGEDVFINVGFFFDGAAPLRIGNNVRIGQFVRVITASHDIGPEHQRCLVEARTAPVVIERGCWIGSGVTIMPGVRIARGCVIGAAATVLNSTEPNGLYAGTPARRLRDLPAGAPAGS